MELVSSLTTLAKKIENDTQKTKKSFQVSDLHEFLAYTKDLSRGIMQLSPVTFHYVECMEKLGVRTRMELEKLWDAHYTEPGVEDAVQSLLQAEKSFSEFVAEVESKFSPFEDKLTTNAAAQVGQVLPKDQSLIDIPSGKPITLEECWKGAKFTLFVLLRLFG